MSEFDPYETTPPDVIGEQVAAIAVLFLAVCGIAATAFYFFTR